MNTERRALDNINNFPTDPFLTLFSRPLLSNSVQEDRLRARSIQSFNSEEKPMTSTARRTRRHLEEHMTQHDDTRASEDHFERSEINIINLPGQNASGLFNPIFISLIEQLQPNLEDEIRQGLPKEMIDKIKRMKMGKSAQDCTVCSESFKKGERIRKLPCKHIFHEKCIMPWLEMNSNCPNCRFNLFEFFTENPECSYD